MKKQTAIPDEPQGREKSLMKYVDTHCSGQIKSYIFERLAPQMTYYAGKSRKCKNSTGNG